MSERKRKYKDNFSEVDETLEEKVHKAEHKLMVDVIGNLSKNFS